MSEAFLKETPSVNQALVRRISETGKKALFIGGHAARIVNWPTRKGQTLLQELLDWATHPQFVYQHNWCVNDLLVYDNRCCLHRGRPWDHSKYKRILHRTTLAGALQSLNSLQAFHRTTPIVTLNLVGFWFNTGIHNGCRVVTAQFNVLLKASGVATMHSMDKGNCFDPDTQRKPSKLRERR